jgi:hypothetical protein
MMMIKTFFICSAALVALSGCMAPGASNQQAGEIPASRIHIKEMTSPSAGENQVTVTRDPGLTWGASTLEFSVNYVALADMKPGESFSAWLPDGVYTFSVKPTINDQKLAPRIINLTLKKGQKHTLRIGGNNFSTILEETGVR